MLTTLHLNSASLEKKRQKTKMKSIDLEMASLSKKESVKTMMQELKLLIMTYSRLKRELTNLVNSPMEKTLN